MVLLLLGGCTAGPPPEPNPDLGPSSPRPGQPATSAFVPTPGPPTVPTPTTYDMPYALVVNMTRTVADVPVAAARKVIVDGGSRWSEIDQPGGRMRVVGSAGRAMTDVLKAVRESDDVLGLVPASVVDETVRVLTVGGVHPLRAPAEYPIEVPSDSRVPEVTTVSLVGDIMLGRRVGARHRDDPIRPLRPLARRLGSAEITVGNVESTVSTAGSPTQGGDSFAADPAIVAGLRRAGFDLVSLANNHLGDYGPRALRQTLDRFAAGDLPAVGAGRDLTAARRGVVLERDGVRIGFLATDSIGETPAATGTRPAPTGSTCHHGPDRSTAATCAGSQATSGPWRNGRMRWSC